MHNFRALSSFVTNAVQVQLLRTEMDKVFGVDIEGFMDEQRKNLRFLHVPWIVRLCSDEMIRRGFDLEGIFRVPGGHEAISRICSSFNQGEVPDFEDETVGLEEVAGVFKKFLHELPAPLFSDDEGTFSSKFAQVLNRTLESEQVEEVRKLIPQLSENRRALIKEIFFILYLVSLESDLNLMDALNLATIFGIMKFHQILQEKNRK
eukprot:TRINITY_DN31152_c0_g1_i1.p1 TRINITY_DN31152_c0_g1~~TRINITY_DN31152_c0_g1_i1.p1  ORF type:complete len:206 (-),score=24.91 TRINITY_DN31152_c0_g1_i1:205-822(-)